MLEKGLSDNTVIHYHVLLNSAFKYAVRADIIQLSPMFKVIRPKMAKFTGQFLNEAEVNEMFKFVRGKKIELAVMLAVFYGLRRSEIVGLKWKAVDFKNKLIKIQHTVTQHMIDGEYQLVCKDRTKSKSSMRSYPLVPEFENLLLKSKEQQEEYKRVCKRSYNYKFGEYIYVNEMGDLIKPNYITQNFKIILKNNNLRDIRFHDLRHTCASLLLNNDTSLKEIQEWLGHAGFSTTDDNG